jgi:hypothetical protein
MKHGKKISVWASPGTIRKMPFPKDLVSKSHALIGGNGLQNKSADYEAFSKKDIRALADLATNLWRAKQRLVGLIEKGSPAQESNKILRPIDSALENLENIGVRIEDYKGQPYVLGMALNVISSQPNSAILSDRICETLKPTIYFRDHFVQAGDVIIEGPPSSSSPSQQS